MTIEEITALLMRIQIIDNRKIDKAVLLEWEVDLAEVDDYPAAMEAVTMHRTESKEWLLPVHIRQNVERMRIAAFGPVEDEWGNVVAPDETAVAALQRLRRPLREVTA
jgi:hypothetical protein